MVTLILLTALAIPLQKNSSSPTTDGPVIPEQVLAWQLEGLTQEEILEEVNSRGLTEYPEEPLRNALLASGADAGSIPALRQINAPRKLWKLQTTAPRPDRLPL